MHSKFIEGHRSVLLALLDAVLPSDAIDSTASGVNQFAKRYGFLDQLRGQFDHVESFLMDRATLMAFESLWGEEEKQTLRDLPRLNQDERALYDDLRDNRIRKSLRLEQERIGFDWVKGALSMLK